MCIFAKYKRIDMSKQNIYKVTTMLSRNGSTENGTVRNGMFLAAIKNRLYLCTC